MVMNVRNDVNPLIDHHCCDECGNSLNDFFCYQCTCEFCGNGAHVGYNCPAQVPSVQTLPSFPQQYPCCEDFGVTHEPYQFRASNLQELVYKQGQAGITKATVLVVFDNSDRSRSPLGYEDSSEITVTRQIVVGGRNKYLINGHLAQPSRVQNLFHSVQLNVNNPHFLIMQGRITKVLNMKPPEILSMLEEAAGTRMYETKKDAALKTLEKKQDRVDAISTDLVKESSVLKNQKDNLATENKNARKIEKNIEELKKSAEDKASAVKGAEDGAADLKKRAEELQKSLEELEKEYQSSGDEEKCLDDQLGDAKVAVGKAETELKQLKTKITHSEKELKENKSKLTSKQGEAVAVEKELKVRQKDVENVEKALKSLSYEEGQMETSEAVHKIKEEIRAISSRLGNVDFSYRDPVKNFDRSKVKGVVAKLVKVGKGNAEVALSLVGYDDELQTAMEYMFGSTFVCKTSDAAQEDVFETALPPRPVGVGDAPVDPQALAEWTAKYDRHNEKFKNVDETLKSQVRLGDDKQVQVEGNGTVVVTLQGRERFIPDVHYAPDFSCDNIYGLMSSKEESTDVWHQRYGHLYVKGLVYHKSEAFGFFKKFKALAENQSYRKLKVLRTDRGGEFLSKEFSGFSNEHGIKRELIAPYTPEHNGIAERKNRTIVEMARCTLKAKNLEDAF
uniref:Structural maintenance of chromosomes protein 2-1 n=1 Tax=Tanacetum cinerariifolium TaxID=118510 RepID=A0A6L2M9W6_TANCI|nr:structural maintenance of chromosomes protein 2-1 [Tanacetum cinerariifolium]